MSRRRSRSGRKPWTGLSIPPHARPRLAILLGAGCVLVWLVVTKSLPFALAPGSPDLALWLSPGNPAALVSKAEALRERLLAQTISALEAQAAEETKGAASTEPALAANPSPGSAAEKTALRDEIRDLANRAIASEPLNATAFRLLAEVTDDSARVRTLMQAAVARSRREAMAQFWLLLDGLSRRDPGTAIRHADMLLKTRPSLSSYVISYLGQMAGDTRGRKLLIEELAKGPKWRLAFFSSLPRLVTQPTIPAELITALRETGQPVSDQELAPYLNHLLQTNHAELAYDTWLQGLSGDQLASAGLLNNAAFGHQLTGLPFDWQIARGKNAIVEVVPLPGQGSQKGIHVSFGNGRITFPDLGQVVHLPPGRYRFSTRIRGKIVAKRGLRWQAKCIGAAAAIGETDLIRGDFQDWTDTAFELEVPDRADCRAQRLRLFHDARSSSEQLISGEAWLDGLRLERL